MGHTDADPPSGRGSFHSNEELSLARATTVSGILAEGLGDPSRLTVEGRGASEPIADNETPEGKARNRRVEILVAREGRSEVACMNPTAFLGLARFGGKLVPSR